MVHAFKGNRAETTTMLPVLRAFLDAHRLSDVTVIADAGMVSEANKRAIAQAGLSFILGARIPDVPYVVTEWRDAHPDAEIPDGHLFVQPWPAGPGDKRRDHTIFYQYKADRARRTLRGIDQQIAKAENAVAGKAAVKRNRYVRLTGATKSVNRALEVKNRALAGMKGYVTNLPNPQPEQVISAYSRLLQVPTKYLFLPTEQSHISREPRTLTDLFKWHGTNGSAQRVRTVTPQPVNRCYPGATCDSYNIDTAASVNAPWNTATSSMPPIHWSSVQS